MSSSPYFPTISDVLAVKSLLLTFPQSSRLPIELIDIIIDYAHYWPHTSTTLAVPVCITGKHPRTGGHANDLLIVTPPLGVLPQPSVSSNNGEWGRVDDCTPHRGTHPCRELTFALSGHDQGWGGLERDRGTYLGSWTWFDVAVILASSDAAGDTNTEMDTDASPSHYQHFRFQPSEEERHPFLPSPSQLYRNRTATSETQHTTITWSWTDNTPSDSAEAEIADREEGRGRATLDGKFVRDLNVGDRVAVWGRARFPGWVNMVEKMEVRVAWAF